MVVVVVVVVVVEVEVEVQVLFYPEKREKGVMNRMCNVHVYVYKRFISKLITHQYSAVEFFFNFDSPIRPFAIVEITKHLSEQVLAIGASSMNSLVARAPHRHVYAFVQRPDDGFKRGFVEERDADSVARAAVNDAVQRAFPQPVGPALNHVADVDDKGAGERVGVEPRPVFQLDLQGAGRGVREEEGYAAVVCVSTAGKLGYVFCIWVCRAVVVVALVAG